jgi:protein CLEC16A
MLAHFVRILVQCTPAAAPSATAPVVAAGEFTGVAVQLLQSLSILVQNTRCKTSIFYLFSNNYINDLMELKQFDFGVDEEVLAWYISFLKAISLRLDGETIQFFVSDAPEVVLEGAGGKRRSEVNAGGDAHLVPAAFSLYTQVIRYVQHQDSMVRAAARVATLNVFQVNDRAVRRPCPVPSRAC